MNLLPYRVRKVISDRCPLAYHVVANLGRKVHSSDYWDRHLEATWDGRDWPTKTARLMALVGRDERVLDVGCGNGQMLRQFAAAGYRSLAGFDISKYACERLRASGITMWQGALPDLPMDDGSYDVVIASQVLEHVIRRRRFVEHLARVLRPGGRAFIFVPDDCLGPIEENEHVIKYTATSLRRFLARTFEVALVESMHDANYPMPVLFAQLVRRSA